MWCKITLISFLFWLSNLTNGYAQWNKIFDAPVPNGVITDVDFPSSNIGYAIGNAGGVFKTIDGGSNWINNPVPGGSFGNYGIDFVNDTLGFMVGVLGKIRKSINGGSSWSDLNNGLSGGSPIFKSVFFTNLSEGYVVGSGSDFVGNSFKSYGFLLKTSNGGSSWQLAYSDTSFSSGLESIFFTNESTGFACGGNGVILRTTNKGVSWNRLITNTTQSLRSIYFSSLQIGYAVGGNGTGVIFKTTDGGDTWAQQKSSTMLSLTSVFFVNDLVGYAGGTEAVLLRTVDGGLHWRHQLLPVYDKLSSIIFTNDTIGYVTLGTSIFKTTDSGLTPYALQGQVFDTGGVAIPQCKVYQLKRNLRTNLVTKIDSNIAGFDGDFSFISNQLTDSTVFLKVSSFQDCGCVETYCDSASLIQNSIPIIRGRTTIYEDIHMVSNTVPIISMIDNISICANALTERPFTIKDKHPNSVVLTGESSDSRIIPNSNITFGGSGVNRTVVFTPSMNLSGVATLTLTSTNIYGFHSIDIFTVTVVGCSLVWPGDANSDLIVNNYDLLPIGVNYGKTGPARSSISTLWQGYGCTDWNSNQQNGMNLKFADCNGDGTINSSDTLAINQNFFLTHNKKEATLKTNATDPDLHFVFTNTVITAGSDIIIELWAGDNTKQVSNLYGLAFDVSYNSAFIQSNTATINYSTSFLGTPGTNAIKFLKTNDVDGIFYGALTRTNHTNASGYGKIATITMKAKTDVPNIYNLALAITKYEAIDSVGTSKTFNVVTGIKTIQSSTENSISVYPNPFTENTNIAYTINQSSTVLIELYNSLGQKVKTIVSEKQAIGKYQFEINSNELNLGSGIYYLKTTINEERSVQRIVGIR